ncbi:hybrid sensor histidine kinase/response regulator [Kamptonema formosum]|uniref:hybrid sensor histidine kinase/response regulator n=1 Tax=Kamptonema formosum TaxID=331992 RepID=UPI00034736A3|nr:hybrid sensor histidine kinase/response regulator [Oscillatoria sp. PCC 10802]
MTKILVIEDEQAIRENILELLDAEEFEAVGAENGKIGIQLAAQTLPDLILCDVMMPEIDGHGVLTQLRQNPATETIPFIFLTALADKTDTRKGMELGADDYLTKPCTPGELLTAIQTRLEKQAAVDRQAKQKLEDLRSNITWSLPHELRTPLNGILGFSQLLLQEPESLEPSEIREMAEQIHRSGQRLYHLIQNFLLYAELELIATDPQRVGALRSAQINTVQSLIEATASEQAKQADRLGDLQLKLEESRVKISENHMAKLLKELIENAFKFSTAGTPVTVTGKADGNRYILSVTDRGRGMTAEQIADVGAYRQFERKLYEQQGSGLGLAIAKRLAELYGGQLKIQSAPQQETAVGVTLPC